MQAWKELPDYYAEQQYWNSFFGSLKMQMMGFFWEQEHFPIGEWYCGDPIGIIKKFYGRGGGRTGTNGSENGVDNLKLNYKNTNDSNLKDNVSKCLNVIKLLANLLSTVEQVVKNLNIADVNIYFLSNDPDNNKVQYISELGNKDLTSVWNMKLPAANIVCWDKDKADLCLQIETFSAYCENYTPFIMLDELMHHAYTNIGIFGMEGVIRTGEMQHIIFYEAMYYELINKPEMIIINTSTNYHFREHIELLYNRHCLKDVLK